MPDSDTDKNKSDQELVELVLKDQENLAYIIERYEKQLTRYIGRISSAGKEDTEDLLQEIFIKVYQNINSFDPDLKFSSWLYRIAHNQTIDYFRKNKNKSALISLDDDNGLAEVLQSEFDLEKDLAKKDLKKEIIKTLEKMEAKYREILILKFLEEKSYREISDILQKPEGTVATLINRAKKEFKKLYEQS
ncbi:RNA polymerase sigma factor [Candidatus Microgenomates bacterium]|nr:RNA polymerase sigma factor [Candidatus Microgenomates bacterium]